MLWVAIIVGLLVVTWPWTSVLVFGCRFCKHGPPNCHAMIFPSTLSMRKVECTRAYEHDGEHVACGAIALKHNLLSWEGDTVTGGSQAASVNRTREAERASMPEVFELKAQLERDDA